MLESLISFKEINRRPWLVLPWSILLTSVAIILSVILNFHTFSQGVSVNLTGLFSVIFTIIPSIFFVTLLIKSEEKLEEDYIKKHYHENAFWERHSRDLVVLLLFFVGITLTFATAAFIMNDSGSDAFSVQTSKICQIRGGCEGMVTEMADGLHPQFFSIYANNMSVLMYSFLLALVFGAGAVFIIVWNASILGVAIGSAASHITHIPYISLAYVLHGVPEIAGYIAAALAGGIISAAIIRRHGSEVLTKVVVDAFFIMVFAVFSIVCGAFIEASTGLYFYVSSGLWWGVFFLMIMYFFLKLDKEQA